MSQAYYSAPIDRFLAASAEAIVGALTTESEFAVESAQRDAWIDEIAILKGALPGLAGAIHLEYIVPRIGSRIDAVVISGPVILVLEFKAGATGYYLGDHNQAWDYALDLKNFHRASHHAPIIPILVATEARRSETSLPRSHADGVYPPSHPTERAFAL